MPQCVACESRLRDNSFYIVHRNEAVCGCGSGGAVAHLAHCNARTALSECFLDMGRFSEPTQIFAVAQCDNYGSDL